MVSLIQILCYRLLEKCQNWLCIYHVHAYCHTNTLEGWIVRLVSAVDTVSLLLYMFRALFVCLSPSLSQISFRVYSWKVAQVEFTYIYIYTYAFITHKRAGNQYSQLSASVGHVRQVPERCWQASLIQTDWSFEKSGPPPSRSLLFSKKFTWKALSVYTFFYYANFKHKLIPMSKSAIMLWHFVIRILSLILIIII